MSGSREQKPATIKAPPKNVGTAKKTTLPRKSAKRLPWLDGGSSPSTPLVTPSPQERRRQPPPSKSPQNSAVQVAGSTSKLRRISRTSSAEPRVVPAGVDPQVQRGPTPRKPASPLRRIAPRPTSRDPVQKLVTINDNFQDEDAFGEPVPWTDSLAPVPAHLDRLESPGGSRRPAERVVYAHSPPPVVKSFQLSPTHPIPRRHPFERVTTKRLSNTIEGLEDLVQEAVEVIEDSIDQQEQVEEIYEIIEDAKQAVQEAHGAPRTLMTVPAPEVSSETSETSASESSSDDTYPPPKITVHRNVNRHEHPVIRTPQRFYREQGRDMHAIDWAYQRREAREDETSLTSTSDIEEFAEQQSQYSAQGDLLLPPQPVQAAAREHVDFVLRPATVREQSRGRPRHRRVMDTDEGTRRYRLHRRRKSYDDRSRSKPRRRLQTRASYNQFDTSHDEEEVQIRRRPLGLHQEKGEFQASEQVNQHTFSLRRNHRRQPIARNWSTGRKRIMAAIACINTALIGVIVGIYAGEVPRIQYMLADERHQAIVGNVVLYFALAISTFLSWTLPLLHGRKPWILAGLAIALPLQFPQAIIVGSKRSPLNISYKSGLLVARAFSGLVLGFVNVNHFTTLLDLFGASLQSKNPHQELVMPNDVRRHGGGMGIWLGIWSWCTIGSLAVGFQIGAGIIEALTPDWGFYITVILLAAALLLNILAPETRRCAYRRSVTDVYDHDENYITRRVSRGEVKLHLHTEGPKYWFEEVGAGIKLSVLMLCQPGFLVLALYLGWIYAQIVLVIVLLGSLLSRDYKWHPRFVGLGVMSIAIGALLAVPLTKAGLFSRERKRPFRTDSMTFQRQVTWSSHLVRRIAFTLVLPLMGLAYTISSAGRPKPYMVPIVFAGAVGFSSVLALAECHGLIMETFDTCDLQPGTNTRHRVESLAVADRRRRTNYSSFPRVTAGVFIAQTISFMLAAVATEVGGIMTRRWSAQTSTGVTAGILFGLTILLTAVLWRFRRVQVIPNHTVFGTRRNTQAWAQEEELAKERRPSWAPVVIGNPSQKFRRMSVLEMGGLSRWTEIRKLNFLVREKKKGGEKAGS